MFDTLDDAIAFVGERVPELSAVFTDTTNQGRTAYVHFGASETDTAFRVEFTFWGPRAPNAETFNKWSISNLWVEPYHESGANVAILLPQISLKVMRALLESGMYPGP